MGDNKISEAASAEECLRAFNETLTPALRVPYTMAYRIAMGAAMEAAAAHLQGEAVPVAWQVRDEDGEWEWCPADQGCYQMVKRYRPDDARALYLHPQPAELSEVSVNSGELPPLPPVDGYDKRVQGHYSAEQMRDYARNAIRSAKQEQACSGMGIDKMAKELLERHTVAVPVAVEDGRCFMVREQDALDAIRAALAATGKQQVGQVHPDDVAVDAFAAAMKAKMADARAKGRGGWEDPAQCSAEDLARMLRDHVEKGDPRDVANFCMMLHQRGEAIAAQVGEVQGSREQFEAWASGALSADCRLDTSGEYNSGNTQGQWLAWQAALASRQPVGFSPIATRKLADLAAQGYVTNGVAIFNPATGQRGLVDNLGYVGWQGAQGIDLEQLVRLRNDLHVMSKHGVKDGWQDAAIELVADVTKLIDGRDAGAGVGND